MADDRATRDLGKLKALVAVARSILVIVWHLLADPTARFHDLGSDFHAMHADKDRKTRNLVHQLQALGHQVTLSPAARSAFPSNSMHLSDQKSKRRNFSRRTNVKRNMSTTSTACTRVRRRTCQEL